MRPNTLPGERLALTTGVQDALFYICTGWTGGAGSAPIVDVRTGRVKNWEGMPLFLEEGQVDRVLQLGQMPDCYVGTPVILVAATIRLTQSSRRVHSIPSAPRRRCCEARVEQLHAVTIWADPCED